MPSTLSLLVSPLSIKATAIATSVLAVKMFLTVSIQGGKRFAGGSRPPEDASLSLNKKLGKGREQTFGVATPEQAETNQKARMADLRWQRIVHNDLENVPLGLLVAWGAALTPASPALHAAAVLAFAAARVAHTYCYAKELQPHRALAWIGGWLALFVMSGNGLVGALGL